MFTVISDCDLALCYSRFVICNANETTDPRQKADEFDDAAHRSPARRSSFSLLRYFRRKVLRFTSSFLHPIDFDFEEIRVLRKEEGPIVDRWSFVETLPNESLMEF